MAGGYISLSGKDSTISKDLVIKALIHHAKNATAGVIDPNLISARYASLMRNKYCYQILLHIPEHEYMMYKMTGQLDEWKTQVRIYVPVPEAKDVEIIRI